ncbi:thiosulfate/3-mercaptopyruvate sulfurtransferase [Azonexus fungiphilus]|uniref:Thiosulfate/3-mercaptopyruvate sulfurtransferase n=1 Tax=Azonexus fungiphilus TaxID=146940 RepID=A0A495WHK2_9RHOO|nr:sulfurtransferase [Azonexus fungiphilus]RKT59338.1 thiosulfate/3-mercaptopyruvate sulfurtransferase [Azonexus fungiphilus]
MSLGTLASVDQLRAGLDAGWCVVDVRHQLLDTGYGERAYAESHIPGAVFLHCDRDLSAPLNGRNGRHPLPEPALLAARLGAIGIAPATQVVVYDDAQGMIAGRLWWLLRWLGHDAVAVLDGGWQAWLAAGGPVDAVVPAPTPATFVAQQRDLTVDAGFVQEMLGASSLCLVDGRAADRFRGENETIDPVGGHIPGAINRFFRDNLAADGRFKPAAELAAEWRRLLAGRSPAQVVHYCGSGVSACHNLLAMEIAGLPGSRLYGGSWSEWCADPQRPVAR